MNADVATRMNGEKGCVVVSGSLDTEEDGVAIHHAINVLLVEGHRTIVLDLSNVTVISAKAIGKILMCRRILEAEDGVLMLAPLRGMVKHTLHALHLDGLFQVDQEV